MTVVDTHLHYYDFYDAGRFISNLITNLEAIAPGAEKAGVILDRAGFDGVGTLAGALKASDRGAVDVTESCIRYKGSSGMVDLYRGIQIACAEGFEVLGLFCAEEIADRVSAAEAVRRISHAGGVPVIAWAPGKWLLKRRDLVAALLEKVDTGAVFLGDTSLRPTFWGEPGLMQAFRARGGRVLCGSDPLPFSGQERVAGSFATVLASGGGGIDLAKLFSAGDTQVSSAGCRSGLMSFVMRMIRNRAAK